MNCKTCRHYHFYLMITANGGYHYAGPIPCQRCSRFSMDQDNYEPARKGNIYEAELREVNKP